MIDLSTFNENQSAAVTWAGGPLLVLAGPGSGKTKVLTTRIAHILGTYPNDHFRVLALTFTNKAATEMRDRLLALSPNAGPRALLTTFHSFAADILRQHGSHLGLKPDFSILTQDADRERVLADALGDISRDGIEIDTSALKVMPVIDRLLSDCVSDEAVLKRIKDSILAPKMQALFKAYKKRLLEHNRVDFGALIYFTIQLLQDKQRIAKQLRTVFTYICVDEFQDTNLAQYTILRLICGDTIKNLFVVADDDQIIYQWNGASPERLQALRTDYKMEMIQLPANYRCPPEVIDIANSLIQHNSQRSPDKSPLKAMKQGKPGGSIRVVSFDEFGDELNWLSEDIKKVPQAKRSNCVVLARTAKLLQATQEHLTAKGIQAHTIVRKNEFESDPIQWLHGVLRLANSRSDQEQLRRICKSFFKLTEIDTRPEDVVTEAALHNSDFLRAWYHLHLRTGTLDAGVRSFLELSKKTIVDRLDFSSFSSDAIKWLDQLSTERDDRFADYKEERELWMQLQDAALKKFGLDDLTLHTLLQEIDLAPKTVAGPPNSVPCMTIHGAKGMEFKQVYLIGLAEDNLPSFQSIKAGPESRELQEERRNCFVAITRTEENLALTYSKKYFGWAKKPSRFLAEMGLGDVSAPSSGKTTVRR
jgi:DNA helicase-2/ATP-dependent DNA helicase PcrA